MFIRLCPFMAILYLTDISNHTKLCEAAAILANVTRSVPFIFESGKVLHYDTRFTFGGGIFLWKDLLLSFNVYLIF